MALRRAGHPDVRVYDGSLQEWSADPALPMTVGGDSGDGDEVRTA